MPRIAQERAQLRLRYRPWIVGIFQACLVFCSLVCAWLLRFDFSLPERRLLFASVPVLIVFRLAAIARFKLLHGWWRYTGVDDALDVVKAVSAGSVMFWVLMRLVLQITSFPRSVYIMEALITSGLLAGVRVVSRAMVESARKDEGLAKRVVLIGAGFAAQMILREINRQDSGYVAIGCVDDDLSKRGMKVHGVRVLGTVNQLPALLARNPADEVLIAVPSATGPQMQRFVQVCEQAGVPFKTVPALREIISGQVSISQLREVDLEDLLGREPARIDLEAVRRHISGRTVLVTGAAGSIGSELCRQLVEYSPSRLICLDQSETGVFFLQLKLDRHQNGSRLTYCVADVCDTDCVHRLLLEFRPEIIFHAAAYKHVPLMERNVQEAVKNNVLALLGLLRLADGAECKHFVLISSDKAVNPTNIMGATKRICELILSSRPPNGMQCVSVRFGNVLGSNGSVIPILKQQLREHQPLTITHPDIKRFFMTTREAVSLVLQSFAIGNHGDILVLDMGQPVRIVDLARSLIRLSGRPEGSVELCFTGLREGEKLEEQLFYPDEPVIATSCDKIKRTKGPLKDWAELSLQLEALRASMSVDGAAPVRTKIKDIVPQYSYHENQPEQVLENTPSHSYLSKAAGMD